jgi:hypothetical protein
MALSLEGDDATRVLDRIQIPNNVRQKISERLTAGSSLIIGDTSVNSAILPAGDDFVVWANDTPPVWEMDRDRRGYTVIRIYRGMDVEEIRVMRAPVAAGLIP